MGGGIIGVTATWLLQQRGHQVTLIDRPSSDGWRSGSAAALGLLMAQVFHRASGRAWRLRQRSLELWTQWIPALQACGHPVTLRRGLLLLAADGDELARQQQLCQQRQGLGLPLRLCSASELADLQPEPPTQAVGGLWSNADGQIDPLPLLAALRCEAMQLGATLRHDSVQALSRPSGDWQLQCESGERITTDAVVVCAAAGTAPLLANLGLELTLVPVLGQALALRCATGTPAWSATWPAALIWRGINLVPRANGELWLGATLEPGATASRDALAELRSLNGDAPTWLLQAEMVQQWQGLRLQPQGRPAPWLEQLAPGLLLAAGHYRNGLLLAPATAEWLALQLEAS